MNKLILLFLSIFFCVAGIVIVSLTGNWSVLAIVFLASGLALLAASLWLWSNQHQFWQKRSTKQSINALITTTVVLSILGLTNILAIRYNMRWDITENQIHTLSTQSQVVVAKLKQPLKVSIFDRTIEPDLENLLQNYRRQSQQFQFRFVNPEQEIGLARQYGVQSLGEIYLEYGDKRQRLNRGNAAVGEPLTESQLTNSIEAIKRDRNINIYLLQGHGEASPELVERGLAQFVTNLEAKGNQVQELNLVSQNKIPHDANLIMIVGATKKLLAAEVSSLQNYLADGGNLLLLLSPNIDIGITPLLENWGVKLDNRLIVDGSGAKSMMGFGPGVIVVNNYGAHPITKSFRSDISIFPESRPLKIQAKATIEATPLAITSNRTWAESDLKNEEITFDINYDLSGPLNIAIALQQEAEKVSRMVIFGSSTFAVNGWFEQQLNGDILLNSVGWLVGEDRDQLSIRPKSVANRRINISSTQARIISWLALRIMPVSALAMGFFTWNQRR